MKSTHVRFPVQKLRDAFGEALQENVILANYTTAHVGGAASALLPVYSCAEIERAAGILWDLNVPFHLLGSGSNVLVSDSGYDGVILLNHARNFKIETHTSPLYEGPTVWAESGANIGTVARQAALRGLSGLEWAATIPGTVGGAVYGNAGAHGGDMSCSLLLAEILHPTMKKEILPVEKLDYAYRSSLLKHPSGDRQALILSATLKLTPSTPDEVQARMSENSARRRQSQPPGASMGSMFKNPPGDAAGRLIEAAGLKGTRVGGAEISAVHANFFINDDQASASDIGALIALAVQKVHEQFGITLELEVELLGVWPALASHS
jgi:UDP-N-acetylmuramate dehydrogenase